MKKIMYIIFSLLIFISSNIVFAGGQDCSTKYPIVLAHGVGFKPSAGTPHSFGGIIAALEAKGAKVYHTTVDSFNSTAEKARQFKAELEEILAVSKAEKVNIIAHSHGGVYARYAITHLGMADKVASLTTVATPHRGTPLADLGNNIFNIFPDLFRNLLGQDLIENIYELSEDYMENVFNPNTPDMPGVYYQSWSGQYRYINPISSIAAFASILLDLNNSTEVTNDLLDGILPHTASVIWLMSFKANDGLVPVSSAKWGNYLGTVTGPFWAEGISHLDENDRSPCLGWDAKNHWVNVVSNLKDMGY